MRKLLFAGPSIYNIRKKLPSDIELLHPISKGQLVHIIDNEPDVKVVGIVDGYFESVPSINHKEILYALSKSVVVYGAASIGALRAAECADFGMKGVGVIFNQYYSGEIERDDMVAIVHCSAELNFRPITVCLFDMIATFQKAIATRIISTTQGKELISIAKLIHFKERTYEKILGHSGISKFSKKTIECWLREYSIDQKGEDVLMLIKKMKESNSRNVTNKIPFAFTPLFSQI